MGNSESQQLLNKIQSECGYSFKNQELLKQCLTHDSLRVENHQLPTYQRLEFLGDAVLQIIITEYLYNKFPDGTEGVLSRKRAELVMGSTQQQIAVRLDLQRYVLMAPSNQGQSPENRFKGYHKFIEALIGGIYLDAGGSYYGQGMEAAKKCIFKLWELQDPTPGNCVVM